MPACTKRKILPQVVAEILGHRQRRMSDPISRPRWFVHLSEDHHGILQHVRLFHLAIEFLGLPAPLTDAAKQADAFMLTHDIVNQFSDQYGLPHTRAAEQSRLAAPFQRGQHVDGFDTGFEHIGSSRPLGQRRRLVMNRPPFAPVNFIAAIDRLAEYVEHSTEQFFSDGNPQRSTYISDFRSTSKSACRSQRDSAYRFAV